MSLESWKEEFYPVPADTEMSTREAILHSIKKWEGLLPENLKKHRIVLERKHITDYKSVLYITADSCALCNKFINDDEWCDKCPLYKTTKSKCGWTSSYGEFSYSGNPQPMIDDLRRALNMFDLGYTE